MAARFHDEHQRRYGYHHAGREIELVTLRLRVRLRTAPLRVAEQATRPKLKGRVTPVERVPVIFHGKRELTPVFERSDLIQNQAMTGPAVITEYSATTVIPPKKRFQLDRAGNLLISIQ
jgi:N-methylhydantoinase A